MNSSHTPPDGAFEAETLVDSVFADRYHLTSVVSDGSNTMIFDADDSATGRKVTIKVVQPTLATNETFRERFDASMKAASALAHPNIAAIYDWGFARLEDTNTGYVVLEQLAGGSLRDMFDRGRQLSPSQALVVGLDSCRGLDYAHRRGFVHGELTPAKLVFGDDRRLRIVDFGLAGLLADGRWNDPERVPTHVAWYAAPEQGAGEPPTPKSDVYALALALHEGVTGELPFKLDSTVASLAARADKLMPVSADLGPLASVLEKGGRPEASDRSDAAELGKALVQIASKLPRPEPLPLLSTGLLDMPADQMRSPDDPTGGVGRPGTDTAAVPPAPRPTTTPPSNDDLVIVPVDQAVTVQPETPYPAPAAPVAATTAMPAVAVAAQPSRSRWGLPAKAIATIAVLASLAIVAAIASRMFSTPVHEVPNLVEYDESEALNLIATNGWNVIIERERSDEVDTPGRVVSTSPKAGFQVAEGEDFVVVVSKGPILRNLPDSTGMTLEAAKDKLVAERLVVTFETAYHEEIEKGIVISWSVPGEPGLTAGSEVQPDTGVLLVVSDGPEPRVVPNLVGMALPDATRAIEALMLEVGTAVEVFSNDVANGAVVAQSQAVGASVARGSTIDLQVSKGPDVVALPDYTKGVTFTDVTQILAAADFTTVFSLGDIEGRVTKVTYNGEPAVVGEMYPRGAQFEVISADRGTTPNPDPNAPAEAGTPSSTSQP